VKCLFNHDANIVLGRTSNQTLKLSDSPEGLNFRCQLDENQQSHRDLYASIKRGDVDECSFAFNVDDEDGDGDSWEDAQDERGQRYKLRTLRSVNLFDVSAVTNPAYGNGATSVSARSTDYVITKVGNVWAAETGPQGERLLMTPDPWAEQRAELKRIDDQFESDRLRARLDRVGAEIAAESR
jgi:HK97 family phage prohead protease